MTTRSFARLLLPAVAAALCVGCAAQPTPRAVPAGPPISVQPFVVEPQPLPEASEPPAGGAFVATLAEKAAASAASEARRLGLGAAVEPAPSGERDQSAVTLAGTVRLPTRLPAGLRGLRADARPGVLASASVRLVAADGSTLRTAEAAFSWREAWWLEGGAKRRRNRPVEEVLAEAVERVVARATAKLAETPL